MRRTILLAVLLLCLPTIVFFVFIKQDASGAQPGSDAAGHPALQQMSGQFEATADISYKGFSATAQITQDSPQACRVEFTAPDSIQGMAFEFNQDTVSVTYKGLSFAFDPSAIPLEAVAKMVVSTVNASLQKEGLDIAYSDGALSVSGSNENGTFSVDLDPDTGNLLKLSVPDHQLEIAFPSFEFLR